MTLLQDIRRRFDQLRRALGDSRLPQHLRDREHLWSSAGSAVQTNNELASFVTYATTYQQYVWVHKAIDLIANAFAGLPVRVVDADGKVVEGHPLNRLFEHGNGKQDPATIWRLWIIHLLIAGENFLQFVDNVAGTAPVEMWTRRPDQVGIVPDADGAFYPAAAEYIFSPPAEESITIPANEMLQVMFQNPLDDWRGLSLIAAVRAGITLDLMSITWTKGVLSRGGEPSVALETERSLTPSERKRLEAILEEKRRSGTPLILDDRTVLHAYSYAPKDMEWLAQREMSREEVGAIFNVPDEMMGFGKDTYENFDKAYKVFWTLAMVPLILRRDAALTAFFTKQRRILKPGQRIATDLAGVGVLQEDDAPRIEKAVKLFGLGVPFDRLDERLKLGIGPIPGGAVGYLPAALLPADEMAAPLPAAAPKGLRRPLRPGQVTRATKARRDRSEVRQARTLQRIRRQVAREAQGEIDAYFAELADAVVGRLRSADAKKAWKRKDLPAIAELLLDADAEGLQGIVGDFAVEVIELSWPTFDEQLGVEVEFGMDDPAVVAALEGAAADVAGIHETTRAAIRELLQYGAEQGWSIDDLIKGDDTHPGIGDVISETYRGRARAIARTEVGNAQQTAAVERYGAAGVEKVKVFDGGSSASCQDCNDLNGTVQTLEWARANRLGHTNCVRAFGPYYED